MFDIFKKNCKLCSNKIMNFGKRVLFTYKINNGYSAKASRESYTALVIRSIFSSSKNGCGSVTIMARYAVDILGMNAFVKGFSHMFEYMRCTKKVVFVKLSL